MDRRTEILKGSIIRVLFVLMWPIVLGNLMQTAYNLADTFWLGKLSKEALAAPTISWPIIWLMLSLSDGIGVAGTALVAQHTGAGNREGANRAAGQVLAFLLIISCSLATAGFLLIPYLMRWMGVEPMLFDKAVSYSRIVFASVPFMFGFFVFSGLLRGVGDTVTPMKLGAISVILNIILDPLLIFGVGFFPRMEVSGAAIATAFSRGVATIAAIYLLFSGKVGVKVSAHHLRLRMDMVKKIVKIGIPSSMGSSGSALAFTMLMKVIASFGTAAISAHGVGIRVTSILRMPVFGLAAATATMVGQNLGADQIKRARRSVWTATGLGFMMMVAGGILCLLLRQYLVRVFIDDPDVVRLGARFFSIIAFSIPLFAVSRLTSSAFQGSGHTIYSMGLSLFNLWVLLLPSAYLAGRILGWGVTGVWMAMVWSNLITAVASLLLFVRGVWERKVIEEVRDV
ncbi:MATE family efflux transporter [Candidatus Poribacteria bacterium]|nr:MATE family efflux transporter [Candidatus Poribacteria bacterium]